jgi:hypothetical protein
MQKNTDSDSIKLRLSNGNLIKADSFSIDKSKSNNWSDSKKTALQQCGTTSNVECKFVVGGWGARFEKQQEELKEIVAETDELERDEVHDLVKTAWRAIAEDE